MVTGDRSPDSVEITGPPDGQPVVFVHGTIFNRTMWAPQRETLADPFRVVTPDMPGHGTRSGEPFRLETAVETLETVVDDLADGSAHVVGLSLGGYVATAFAHRHPDAVESLVLSGSSANPVGLLGTVIRVLGEVSLLASRSDLVERATDWLTAKYVRSRDLEGCFEDEIVAAGFDLKPFGQGGREIAGEDFRAAFAAFPGRALVCNGQFDLVMRLGERDHAAAGDADRRVVEGAGHICNLDRPDEYTAAIRRFLSVHAGASD